MRSTLSLELLPRAPAAAALADLKARQPMHAVEERRAPSAERRAVRTARFGSPGVRTARFGSSGVRWRKGGLTAHVDAGVVSAGQTGRLPVAPRLRVLPIEAAYAIGELHIDLPPQAALHGAVARPMGLGGHQLCRHPLVGCRLRARTARLPLGRHVRSNGRPLHLIIFDGLCRSVQRAVRLRRVPSPEVLTEAWRSLGACAPLTGVVPREGQHQRPGRAVGPGSWFRQILLVLAFRCIEARSVTRIRIEVGDERAHLRCDRRVHSMATQHARVGRAARNNVGELLGARIVDCGAVLRAEIVALPVCLRRVMARPEPAQQIGEGDDTRVEYHAYRLRVARASAAHLRV